MKGGSRSRSAPDNFQPAEFKLVFPHGKGVINAECLKKTTNVKVNISDQKTAEGGEGTVHLTDMPDKVVKIYFDTGKPGELDNLGYLEHLRSSTPMPHIMKSYGSFQCGPKGLGDSTGKYFSIIERIEGQELVNMLYEGTLEPVNCKKIFKHILMGLNELHSQKCCHLDIKLENIMVGPGPEFKATLVDFGGMKTQLDVTSYFGTPLYIAPEVMCSESGVREPKESYKGNKADMFNAGCVLYAMIVRSDLFPQRVNIHNKRAAEGREESDWTSDDRIKYMADIKDITIRPDQIGRLSHEEYQLISNLVSKNPDDRLSASEALEHPYFTEEPPPPMPAKQQRSWSGSFAHSDSDGHPSRRRTVKIDI